MDLQTPIREAGRIYKMYASRLEKLGIKTVEDFLYHIPFRYDDYSIISKIGQVQVGETVTIQGTVTEIKNEYTKNWKKLQKAKIKDETGEIEVIWFNQLFLVKVIHVGNKISLSGKIDWFAHRLVMQSPEYEIIYNENNTIHTGRLVPVYPETRGISSKWLRRQIYKIIQEYKHNLLEYIPYSIINYHTLMELNEAIEQIHFPKSLDYSEKARYCLSFIELFLVQLSALRKKIEWEQQIMGNSFSITKFKKRIEEFWQKLPFELTNAQKKAVREIFQDLAGKKPMNRLLEGDVGSGKTVVSAIAMYLSYLNGCQSMVMAPTEILANQHYHTISKLLSPLDVKVGLITSSNKNKKIQNIDIFVGTHALLYRQIDIKNLGLVVIDEQQRFGVEQRSIIRQKGENPHLLTMTATPIPRTVALTIYGNLDLSYLDEMPKGRKYIKTWLVPPEKRNGAYEWITKQVTKEKDQVFIICPFIEESESMKTIKAATKEYDYLKNNVFKKLSLGLIHGRLKAKEKDSILEKFREGKIDILVATPVVEVGIDIPNATIIIIEAAERFGLAQLHQLRGRVGRGTKQSYCLLFTESKNEQVNNRLKAMETLHIGADLAELDLKLRGPGEVYGTMQHGKPILKIANFEDTILIEKTRAEAKKILPQLNRFPLLVKKLQSISIKYVSPN